MTYVMTNNPDSALHHEELLSVTEERFQKMTARLKAVAETFQEEDIHDFRIEIKKLKALLRLFREKAKHPSDLKFPKFLDKIYRLLGSMREMQLQQNKLGKAVNNQNSLLSSTFSVLDEEINAVKEKIIQLLKNEKSMEKAKDKFLKFIPEKLTRKTVDRYFVNNMKKLKRILSMKRLSIEPLHQMRKILKDLQYNRFYRQENETQEPETATLPLDEIHYTTTIIGDLHDAYAATALMEKELHTNSIQKDEKTLLLQVRLLWKKERSDLRKPVDEELNKLRTYPYFGGNMSSDN